MKMKMIFCQNRHSNVNNKPLFTFQFIIHHEKEKRLTIKT